MSECFNLSGAAAAGTDKAIINVFNSPASPTVRPRLYYLLLGSTSAAANNTSDCYIGRTTAVGTEGTDLTSLIKNLDPAGPAAGHIDAGGGAFSVEPTKTANAELLHIPHFQLATFQWAALKERDEIIIPATQNNGIALISRTSSGTPTLRGVMRFNE